MLVANPSKFKEYFSLYSELRWQNNSTTAVTSVKGNIVQNVSSSISGVSCRSFSGGKWGFSCCPSFKDDEIRTIIKESSVNANSLAKFLGSSSVRLQHNNGMSSNSFVTTKPRVSMKEIIELNLKIDNYIANKYPKLASRRVVLSMLDMEKQLLNSEGAESYSLVPRSLGVLSLIDVHKDGSPVELNEFLGGRGQFEDSFNDFTLITDTIDKTYEHLMKKKESVHAKGGISSVILDSALAGILAHEAIGHTTEADLVLGGSVAADYLHQKVASPLITLVDYANTALGKTCPVPLYTDDEGTKATDVVIIKDGILNSFMHNKESAEHFKVAPTGNARAYQFSDEPLIRMRNTAIVPGKSKIAEMISSIENGYYLIKSGNGQADSTSEFMFGITLGYEIKNGKLGAAIRDTTVSGIAFDMLKTVEMVSDDMKWSCGGMCGKKQMIPVGMGGPALKCKINIGGVQ